MTGQALGTQAITRQRSTAGEPDAHGNVALTWDVGTDITGCQVDPGPTREDLVNRDTVLTTWFVFAPDGTDVTALDRVVYAGDTYRVDGKPVVFPDPGGLGYVKITLVEWTG